MGSGGIGAGGGSGRLREKLAAWVKKLRMKIGKLSSTEPSTSSSRRSSLNLSPQSLASFSPLSLRHASHTKSETLSRLLPAQL